MITPSLKISLVKADDAAAVLAFEQENRQHFEEWIASRGDDFYYLQEVRSSLEQAQYLANAKREYHYLAWVENEVVGRITLRGVEQDQYHKAFLGYRFSQRHGGHGYATAAVNAVVNQAFDEFRLNRIEAVVIIDNLPSQAIMRKCGFNEYGHSHASVLRNGIWMDMLHYEKLNTVRPA
ncbi:GNAT family N-acetyltransferase [Undibacterium pigrum]|uniref:Ribosomal-protein-alanine N-acetyltransferase n=1 Tax=Undibacterium pigrum TaxID=401470 RepID=A0A318JJ69_9BURK|nr:GNAT family N-acetyltransferase [Undibacterium pigrum]PXX47393.1 ribosomal-protein-alanine N-acetyltransferase [Undibacterium pigrum]